MRSTTHFVGSPTMLDSAWPALLRLDEWFELNGFAGWDPYDLKGTKYGKQLYGVRPLFFRRILLRIWDFEQDFFPVLTRQILRVQPSKNAKALGLMLASYASLYKFTGSNKWLKKSIKCAEALLEMKGSKYPGANWGYPFDWQSIIHIPAGTPSSVVCAIVGDGFFRLFEATQEKKWLEVCMEICEFFSLGLRITYDDGEGLCYSYTPLDDFRVHNANLFVGEFLTRVGRIAIRHDWTKAGISCGHFALSEQYSEGFLPYWSRTQTDSHSAGKIKVDHYHSGFEIRQLWGLWLNSGEIRFKDAAIRYFKWYKKNLFNSENAPKPSLDRFNPIDIHACAESILCMSTMVREFPFIQDDLVKSLNWILTKMEFLPGQYAHKFFRVPIIGMHRVRIPMIRWGQAWMLRALSEAILQTKA